MSISELIGVVGVAAVLSSYFLVQANWLDAVDWRYQCANMLGSVLILYSLVFDFNLPSAIIQVIWFVISAFGLLARAQKRRTSTNSEPSKS